MKESAILRQITDLLTAEGILWFRNNVGAVMFGEKRFTRFGVPGMADLVCYFQVVGRVQNILWIECKNEIGKLSEAQKKFQALVESRGHYYIVARSSEDVLKFVRFLES